MKKNTLATPLLLSASLASVVALNLSCGKKPSNLSAPETAPGENSNLAPTRPNPAPSPVITNTPAAITTTPAAPVTPDYLAPTAAAVKTTDKKWWQVFGGKTVEMSTNVPAAPKNFYSEDFSTNHVGLLDSRSDFYFSVRAGYAHASYGNDRDTWYAGIKFYANPTQLRARAGKGSQLIGQFTRGPAQRLSPFR